MMDEELNRLLAQGLKLLPDDAAPSADTPHAGEADSRSMAMRSKLLIRRVLRR